MNKPDKSKQLREYIRGMEHKLGILEDGEMSCCGITIAQCHALVEIGNAGSISLVDLSEILNLDNSTMSRTVNNLVNVGLAERELDPSDRRYVKIKLTESGFEKYAGIEEGMKGYYSRILELIPEEKREQVLESLGILLDAIIRNECSE